MSIAEIDLHSSLKKYFGFSGFKGLQEEVIKNVVEGNNTFVIMPTGGGKSLRSSQDTQCKNTGYA